MRQYYKNKLWRRLCSWLLAAALLCVELDGTLLVQAAEGQPIAIQTAEELRRIGADSSYPMDGDYVLAADIDLSGSDWIPFGGYIGNKGTCNPGETNVFSGTFDGQGHVISGLTIRLDGSVNRTDQYGQVGLFSVIGSNSPSDYAEVRNIIFTDVSITVDFEDGLAAVGALAGEVNGYASVSGIAVLDGDLNINRSARCDTVGAGGIIGECRTQDNGIGNGNISVTDCYNGANLQASGSRSDLIYAGGIVGRVAKSACKAISQCVNTGMVQYDGYDAFGIASAESGNDSLLSTLADCYYSADMEQLASGQAVAVAEKELTGGVLPGNLSGGNWRAEKGCYPVPAYCYQSSAAGRIYLSGLALAFAEGESASGMKTEVALPQTAGEHALVWTSSQPSVLTVEPGRAVAHPEDIGVNTSVMLTAETPAGYSRSFKITVLTAREQAASFEQGYAKVGEPLTVKVSNTEGMQLQYQWKVDGAVVSNTADSYTPSAADLEKFISVTITTPDNQVCWELSTYCSQLPVVYIDTNDGKAVTSNTVAKDAVMKVQGNQEFSDQDTWYEGETTIKGRGNSTWSQAVAWNVKKPYKLKLDTKANLLGLGTDTNKHWVLLANMIDHTNMRNELAHNFSRDIGMNPSMGVTNVVLILNGEYQGVYELSEHVRVGKARVPVHDWEELADDVAKAVCKKEKDLDKSALETALEEDFGWISGSFQYKGKTYRVADYYTKEIPDITGGFLLDMDFRSLNDQYKYISTFQTVNGIPMFFRSPEYARTSSEMMDYARNYLNAYETAIGSPDFTAEYHGETVHYTDLFDLDSLLQYWLLCEYVDNWDSMKNSSYLYKDLEGKAKMGPAWDYDWAWGNINMYSMTGPFVYDQWHTTLTGIDASQGGFAEQAYQKQQWNRYLVRDPYFVTKAYEYYKKYRPTVIEEMIRDGGVIDTLEAKYQTASEANDRKWNYSYGWYSGFAFVNGQKVHTQSQNYREAVESMRTFIRKRVEWLDQQFTSVENVYASMGNHVSDKISVSVEKAADGTVTAAAQVSDSGAAAVVFLVNGRKVLVNGSAAIPVKDQKASVTLDSAMLEQEEGALNTVEALGVDSSQSYLPEMMNFTVFDGLAGEPDPGPGGDDKPEPEVLIGNVEITSSRSGQEAYPGDTLTAAVTESNNSGELSYQWYAQGEAITGAEKPSYKLKASEVGKKISVEVESTVETGSIRGVYTGTVTKQPVKAKKINLPVKSKEMYPYQTWKLKPAVSPAAASQKVSYTVDKKSVAAVSQTGKITAKSPGTAKITVKAADGSGVKAVCRIHVQKPVIKVSGKTTVKPKKSITLTAKAYGLKGKVAWKLDAKGRKLLKLSKAKGSKVKLTAGKYTGKAKLTITCGKKKVTKTIRVKK